MHRRFNRTQRNYIIAGLCMILVIMAVGYAAFSSQLKISGTSNISGNFNIQITNIESVVPSEMGADYANDGYNISEPTYTPDSATFSAGFDLPGSEIDYVVEISNLGNIKGQVTIGNLNCGDNSAIGCYATAMDKNPLQDVPNNYIDFDNGNQDYSNIEFSIKPGEKHYIVVGVIFDDVTTMPDDLDANIQLDLTYEQYFNPNLTGETVLVGNQEVDVMKKGDGLYEDEYELEKYDYRGNNPDNYIQFNDELWRIISVESDGTIKIMRNEIIGDRAWESLDSNDWAKPVELNTYLNEEYLPTLSDFDKVVSHNWNIGGIIQGNSDLVNQINDEKSKIWNGKVALPTVSEYLRANSNMTQCGTVQLNNANLEICTVTNWMFINSSYWTLSPLVDTGRNVLYVKSNGSIFTSYSTYAHDGVIPVLYLSSNITLTGEGTETNPYIIS